MATFEEQVEGLTGLTIGSTPAPTSNVFTDILREGVRDVVNRFLILRPEEISKFAATTDSGAGTSVAKIGQILSVMREHDSTSILRKCTLISASNRYEATDSDSLFYHSKINPGYYELDGSIHTVPAAAEAGHNNVVVTQVAYDAGLIGGDTYGGGNIANFPVDYEHLVVLYASIQSLQAALANSVISLSITSPTAPSAPVLSSPGIATTSKAAIDGNVPTYTKPVMDARTAFSSFTSGLSETDPGTLTISAVVPVPPADPSFTAPGTISTTISNIGTPPTYTVPSITSTAGSPNDLTDMIDSDWSDTGLDYDFDDENIDFATWFQAAGDMIQNQQDTELASAQLQKISTYINAYNTSMQNQLNKFNDANVEYQAKLQEATRQADIDSRDSSQTKSLLLQKEHQEYAVKLQKYGSEVSRYQAEVNTEVQVKQTNLSQYSAELTTSLQAWQKEQSDKIQQYQSDIQNALNEFNKENVKYQANIQAEITKAQIDAQEAQKEGDMTLQASIAEDTNDLQRYQAEVADYQAEVAKEVQESTTKVQQYQLLYTQLKQQYDAAFGIAAPQEQRR